jgi:hypothetical protein
MMSSRDTASDFRMLTAIKGQVRALNGLSMRYSLSRIGTADQYRVWNVRRQRRDGGYSSNLDVHLLRHKYGKNHVVHGKSTCRCLQLELYSLKIKRIFISQA